MARGEQVGREWKLLQLLSGRYGRTLAQLAAELAVTRRTVQRDLAVLESAGFPLTSENRNGTVFWRLRGGFEAAAPVSLSREEALALYFSRGLLEPLKGTTVFEAFESALAKIARASSRRGTPLLAGLEKAITVSTFGRKDFARSRPALEAVTRALFHRLTLRLRYQRPTDAEPVERVFDPYTLWFTNNGLYVVGRDHRARDLRTFALERIRAAEITNQRFELPEDFDFARFRSSAFQMVWGETKEVKIWFAADQAPYVAERLWHPSQRIEPQPDGSIIMTLRVADVGEVERWLFGFRDAAKLLSLKSRDRSQLK